MHTVVTSFSPRGWKEYARDFVDSFYANMPAEVRLLAYWEGERPDYPGLLAGYDLLSLLTPAAFYARHAHDPVVAGKKEGTRRWSGKARKEGYSLRHDAYKFSHKVFAIADAARRQSRGRLFWIDADVTVDLRVPIEFLNKLLPEDANLCYLRRPLSYSELGFVGYNLDVAGTREFLYAYEAEYALDTVFARPFWDDCNVFDALVKERAGRLRIAPIDHESSAQPFDNSVLGEYMTHHKGPRKYARDQNGKRLAFARPR